MAERLRLCFWSRDGAEVRTSRLDGCQATWFSHYDGQARL